MDQSKYPLWALQITQADLSQIAETGARWEIVLGQLLHRLRQQDLATLGHPEKPGESVEGRREIVIVLRVRLPGVQRHANTEGSWEVGPGFATECALRGERRGEGILSSGKGRLRAIAYRLVERPPMFLDRLAQEHQLPLDGSEHCRPVSLPERRAALDVREEECDSAAGKIGHDRVPCMRSVEVFLDCRMRRPRAGQNPAV